eukprot:Partr_v1_DN27846_c1_g2_i3_m22619 putative SNF8, ESCRT-II complex subunit, homolog (S. cerevisiae)
MRRGLGVAGIQRQQRVKEQYREVGNQLASAQIAQMQQQLEQFKLHLQRFATEHRHEIRKSAEFRMHFQRMCQSIGVDPLASNKGFWAEVLGVGDYYYELAVLIIEACMRTKSSNGGLLELPVLTRMVSAAGGGASAGGVSEDDVLRAL